MPHILDVQFPEQNPSGAPGGDYEDIRSSPEMFGALGAKAAGEFGEGLTRTGVAGIDYATDVNRLQDQIHASELHSNFSDKAGDLVSKFTELQGRAALDNLPALKTQIEGLQKEAEGSAGNLFTKSLVAGNTRFTMDRLVGWAEKHADAQRTQWATTTAKNNIDAATNTGGLAIANLDFDALDKQMNVIDREAHNYFDPNGYDPQTLSVEVSKYKGEALKNWVETAATNDKDPDALTHAVQIYRRYEADIDPAHRLEISKALNAKTFARSVDNIANYYVNGTVAGIPASFIAGIKQSEGYSEKPYWDVDRWSIGYGTAASGPDEKADRFALEGRFEDKITEAANFVDSVAPHLDLGTRAALTSLTYETGQKWASSGLGEAIKQGDLLHAQQLFLQYNQVAGAPDANVMQRRVKEAQWFGQSAPQNVSKAQVADVLDRVRSDPLFADRPELQAAVEKNILAKTAMQDRADALADKAAREQSDATEEQVFHNIHSDKPTVTEDQIMADPTMTREAKERMVEQLERVRGTDTKAEKTYGDGFYDLYRRVHLPDSDPQRITDPGELYGHVGPNGDLTVAGVDKLVAEINGKKTPEGEAEGEIKKQFLANARAQITGTDEGLHIRDPKGDELYLKFLAQALPLYDAGRKSGKSASQLLNPDSPDYIGSIIKNFKRPMDQWVADTVHDNPSTGTTFDPTQVKSLDDLVALYREGRVSKSVADATAIANGWAVRKPAAAPVQVPMSQ